MNKKTFFTPAILFCGALSLSVFIFLAVNICYFLTATFGTLFYFIKTGYHFGTVILPLIFTLLSLIGIHYYKKTKNDGFSKMAIISISLAVFLFCLRIYTSVIEPNNLKVRYVEIHSPKIHSPMTIAHITDIQTDHVSDYDKKAFAKINSENPDLILFTGDLIHPIPPNTVEAEVPAMLELLQTLKPRLGVYGVYGDVDYVVHRDFGDKIGNMKMLNSEKLVIEDGENRISLLGLSGHESRDVPDQRLIRWMKDDSDKYTLLMGHAPDYINSMNNLPVDLCLAGHTHGGQIRAPLFGAIVTLSAVPRNIARGFNEIGKTRINVSAGIGCEHAGGLNKIRFNCPPEFTIIKLLPEEKK